MLREELIEDLLVSGAGGGGGKGGGGGGKKGGRRPQEDPESLRSRSDAQFVAVISEGEIQAFTPADDPLTRVYLDDTPIKSPDGRYNFAITNIFTGSSGAESGKGGLTSTFNNKTPGLVRNNSLGAINGAVADYRVGTQNQAPMPGFDDVRVEQSVGLKVTNILGEVTKTTPSALFSRLRVRVGVGSLFFINESNGDVKGSRVEFQIRVVTSTGSVLVNERRVIAGKSRGPVDFEYEYKLSGTGPWTVGVQRITADATSTRFSDDFFFKALVGIIDQSFRYPNTALVGVKVGAENFSSVPRVSADLLGLKIKVPTNYNPDARTYSGVWNGTFKTVYSNNPAWVFYDLLTNKRYGAGEFINESQVDKFALYAIGQYCDQRVPNGRGGTEPRFTFNAYITSRGEAYDVLNSIAASFRGMLYYQAGSIVPVQDVPKAVTKIFTPANVIQQQNENGEVTEPPFTYEGTARKARKTIALVSWNDPDDFYKEKIEYVEDRDGLDRYGYNELQIRAIGTTSQGQAQRIGRWALLTDQLETEVVSFKVAAEGFFLMPGEIIGVADPSKGEKRYGGRIVSATTTALTLDSEFVFTGAAYSLSAMLPDGTVQTRTVTSGSGTKSAITVAPAFSTAPQTGAVWVLQENDQGLRKFRVISAAEDDGQVTVVAVLYVESKYALADSDTILSTARITNRQRRVLPIVRRGSIVLGAPQ
jgi:predicted phage tail protein